MFLGVLHIWGDEQSGRGEFIFTLVVLIIYDIVKNVLSSFVSLLQPPPQIYDKQLDEREHTIEEWKGAHSSELGGEVRGPTPRASV